MRLERLWNGWRAQYVQGDGKKSDSGKSVFTEILESDMNDEDSHIVAIANTKILPEALDVTAARVRSAWKVLESQNKEAGK